MMDDNEKQAIEVNNSIIPLFATPLYTRKASEREYIAVQEEMQHVVDKLYQENVWAHKDGWNSTTHRLSNKGDFSKNILKEENMHNTMEFIMHHCFRYMTIMKVESIWQPEITESWLTLTQTGQYAHTHDHGAQTISGVYWFKTNGRDGDIFFLNALKALKCSPIGNTVAQEAQFMPEQGRLAMWPAFLDHGVRENKTPDDRISLSFNIQLTWRNHGSGN